MDHISYYEIIIIYLAKVKKILKISKINIEQINLEVKKPKSIIKSSSTFEESMSY